MRNYKTRLPGIDRSSEAKNPPTNGSSALQKGTKEYTNVGTAPQKNILGGLGGMVSKVAGSGMLGPIGMLGSKLMGGGKKKGGAKKRKR